MTVRELVCSRCGNTNRRVFYMDDTPYSRFMPLMFEAGRNPRNPELCSVCGTNLLTGRRGIGGRVLAIVMWTGIYGLHALVMMMAVVIPVAINWPENDWMVRVAALIGAAAGLGLAEWSRRRKKLL